MIVSPSVACPTPSSHSVWVCSFAYHPMHRLLPCYLRNSAPLSFFQRWYTSIMVKRKVDWFPPALCSWVQSIILLALFLVKISPKLTSSSTHKPWIWGIWSTIGGAAVSLTELGTRANGSDGLAGSRRLSRVVSPLVRRNLKFRIKKVCPAFPVGV